MLSTVILAFAVAFLTQLMKPALKAGIMPQDKPWQNTALRGVVFVLAYILVVLNTLAQRRLDWGGAWGLLETAGVVFAIAVTTYHVLDDTAPLAGVAGVSGEAMTPAMATGILPPVEHAPVSVPSNTTPQAVAVGGKHSTKVITSGAPATVTAGTPAPQTPPAGQTPPGGA